MTTLQIVALSLGAAFFISTALDVILFRQRRRLVTILETHVVILQTAVSVAGETFNTYADMHLAKDTAEGRDKAAKNRRMGEVMDVSLRATGHPGSSKKMRRNVATAEGREFGEQLARLADMEARRTGVDGRCDTCAFREGMHLANGSPETLMDAMKCALEGEPFYCHEQDKPCAGWLLMRSKGDDRRPVPWPMNGGIE